MFILLFKNSDDDPARHHFDKYYMPLAQIKDFDQPMKNKSEAYEKFVEMSKNNDYTTVSLLDYSYHQNYYKLIGTVLSKQRNTTILQQRKNRTRQQWYKNVPYH